MPAAIGGVREVENDGDKTSDVLDADSLEVELGDHWIARVEAGTGTISKGWVGGRGDGVGEGDDGLLTGREEHTDVQRHLR